MSELFEYCVEVFDMSALLGVFQVSKSKGQELACDVRAWGLGGAAR